MSDPKIILPVVPVVDKVELLKSHVASYTRKDGSVVAAHDDSRTAAQKYDHPNVVGKFSAHKVVGNGGRGEKDGNGDPTHDATTSVGFAGKKYNPTGKTGESLHDKTPVHEFEAEDGHRVWGDASGRVHADGTSEVKKLRAAYEAHDNKRPASKKTEEKKPLPDDHDFGAHLGSMKDGDKEHFSNSVFKNEKFHVEKNGDKYHFGGVAESFFGKNPKGYSHEEASARMKAMHGGVGFSKNERIVHNGKSSKAA